MPDPVEEDDEPKGWEDPLPQEEAEPAPPPPEPPASTGGEEEVRYREVTPRECRALAERYGHVTRSDEQAKLKEGLTEQQRQTAVSNIDAAAKKLEARWQTSCESSLIGQAVEEAAMRCAMASRSVAAFDVCLNGPR